MDEESINSFNDDASVGSVQSGFFKTQVQFEETKPLSGLNEFSKNKPIDSNDVRLPQTCNFIALRETLLSEAPFISRSSRLFWRKMLDEPQFKTLMAASYHVVSQCVADNGCVNVDRLSDMNASEYTSIMGKSLSEMIFNIRRQDRDILFHRLPELLVFMCVNALHTVTPKHHRVYNSFKFRDLILDWTTELISGIRPTNTRTGREWLYQDCSENTIILTKDTIRTNIEESKAKKKLKALTTNALQGGTYLDERSSRTNFLLEYSPLVNKYLDIHSVVNGPRQKSLNALKMTLSHAPYRPLLTLNENGQTAPSTLKSKKSDFEVERKEMKKSMSRSKKVMKDFENGKLEYKDDLNKMRDALKTHLAVLSNKKVSKKQLLAAMTNVLDIKRKET